MPYITREDGEHFVIPSYRDVLTVKQKSQLKKEILLLSQSYGEYITLQKKSATQYEVAFSPDTGYLLGESLWHNFKKPLDMIYCEVIPNTTEAILVIVKSGSVYLDGSFPLDSIPEELIIFLTQQNNFEIYVYGDVPISQEPEAGKFSFEPSSVKSFNVLDKPVFPSLPLLKMYQLQLVDPVLKAQGIGVFPTKQLLGVGAVIVVGYLLYMFVTSEKEAVPTQTTPQVNPYQLYLNTLSSPAPSAEISEFVKKLQIFYQMPGWEVSDIKYIHSQINADVLSNGGTIEMLSKWADDNQMHMIIKKNGITVTKFIDVPKRSYPKYIYSIDKVISRIVDKMATVNPGNNITLGNFDRKGNFTDVLVTIKVDKISPTILDLIGKQFNDLPLVLHDLTLSVGTDFVLTGTITIDALGS
jgi:hypothetical protein